MNKYNVLKKLISANFLITFYDIRLLPDNVLPESQKTNIFRSQYSCHPFNFFLRVFFQVFFNKHSIFEIMDTNSFKNFQIY